ncbi:hypothetical protein FRC00_013472, partial [Tulasnella sp. 408]
DDEDEEDTEGGETGSRDLNFKPGCADASSDLDATYNPDDADDLTYSEGSVHETFEVKDHYGTLKQWKGKAPNTPNEGKGKAPSTLRKVVVEAM